MIARGIERREIFKDDDNRKEFLRRFSEGLKTTGSKCYGWALMPNRKTYRLYAPPPPKKMNGLIKNIEGP